MDDVLVVDEPTLTRKQRRARARAAQYLSFLRNLRMTHRPPKDRTPKYQPHQGANECARRCAKLKALVLVCLLPLVLGMSAGSCGSDVPAAVSSDQRTFALIRHERIIGFGSVYVLRHARGACFVVFDPGGEGGGAVAPAPATVCDGEDTER